MAKATYDLREEISWLTTFEEKAIRIVSFVIALMAIALTLPLTALIALAIKIDSPGPAIFKQRRIGKNLRRNGHLISRNGKMSCQDRRQEDLGGKAFTFYKFRTMYVNANERFPELYRYQYSPEDIKNLYFKIPDDPRLTRLGRRLRKTTLDELPNFLNLLKGDMNLVGPRPDIPEMIKYYEGWQRKKFRVKPGITGLAQINGRGLLSFQETLKIDVEYVEKKSPWIDFWIILKTVKATFFKIGAF
jgi:lipopolysaccharide/colanic/teichoic acid biosynthesis glycosyltransferase